ncbi:hypothetical protein DAPPUDRAFT_263172 [Daphnia pulex]|uniref:K Homology domain-containing protein n=1 Tax=Daphnia pulex TaxID=6669 RepID=E9HP91_DAPPU|nr:hypothetical protein DAPPUDRAFT_263172 [Daphnia pulex]|eukprot:EFX66397.1 hypothetical protein DAPPUDRAFT_263172 [Daphnia pulex]
MDFFRRMTESQARRSAVNLNKIKPDVACSNQHALPRPEINDGFSTASGEDLNNQSFLRLKAKVDENNLIVLENERLANELSLVQSQLTDSHSKLRQFRIESATTKTKLEKQKRFITDITVKNIRLTNEDSRLRRTLESTNYFLESSRAESERLRTSLAEQQLDTREFAVATRELESKNKTISELETENLRLAENDSQLRREIEDRDKIIASSAIEKNLIVLDKERLENELNLVQSQLADSSSNLQMFQNIHDELETTKCELENNKREMTDMTEKNLRLTNDDSRLRRKIEDRDRMITLIVLDKESLANELSLVQSQLTDSSSKLQMFQNIHELETTKCELEEKERVMTEIIGENLHLTKENSVLMRKIEAKDRLIAYKRTKLEELHNCYEEKKLHKVHNELASSQRALVSKNRAITKLQEQNQESRAELEQLRTCLSEQQLDTSQLAVATRELESKTKIIIELEAKNLSLAENDGRLRRKMEDDDRLLQSSQSGLQQLQDELQQLLNNVSQLKQTMEDSGRLLLSSKVTIEELQLSLNKQTERVEQLVNQIRSKNEEVAELTNKKHQLEQNDQRLRQIIEDTQLLVESSNDELENLRVCLAEQQLDKVHELAIANCEIESKNKTISELETENFRLAENDSQLRRKMEDTDLLLASSHAEVEGLRVSMNNQTESVKHLQDQVKSLDHEKDEAIRKLAELEAKQKEMKPKLTSDVRCGSDEVINPLRIEDPIKIVKDTPIVVTAEPQLVDLSPARTEIESRAAQVSTEKPPAEFEKFSILSSVKTEVYIDRIVVTGIANKDCGRVIGRHGSNAKRIEEQYWVSVSFINGNLFITGGDAESRQAACNDVIDILSVTIECPKINLRRNIFSDGYALRELAFNHDVHIYRPCGENKYVTIWGTLANCQRVHEILQNGNR